MEHALRKKLEAIIEKEREHILSVIKNSPDADGELLISDDMLSGKGCDISIRPHTSTVAVPKHRHTYLEIMILLSGTLLHRIENKTVALKCGEILFLNKHMSHSIEAASDGDIAINLVISDRFAKSLSPELAGTVFSELLKENLAEDGRGIYMCFSAGARAIENLTENLLEELSEPSPRRSILTKTVELLLTYLSQSSDKYLTAGNLSADRDNERMRAISTYIKDNRKTASLRELAGILYLSMPYLSKYIKEKFGKSFKELLIEERIRTAENLILKTDMTVGDIIGEIGYESESYFHREFKKRMGTSPLTYRRNNAKT